MLKPIKPSKPKYPEKVRVRKNYRTEEYVGETYKEIVESWPRIKKKYGFKEVPDVIKHRDMIEFTYDDTITLSDAEYSKAIKKYEASF